MAMAKRLLIGGVVLAVLATAAFLSNTQNIAGSGDEHRAKTVDELAEMPEVGYRAPAFELQTFDGKTVKLSDLRGKPVVLNLWASWCGPCRSEMPDLEAAHQQYKDKVVLYGINFAASDEEASALALLKELGVTFPSVKDDSGDIFKKYQAVSIPSTFAIDKNGMIVEKRIGAITKPQIDGMFQRLAASE
jgi:thiol-disulfide isomerase/thioredoxin